MNKIEGLRLPKIWSDGMVIQRDKAINLWGYIAEGEKVTIHFAGEVYRAVGDKTGKWFVTLPPLPAGGPYEMKVESQHQSIVLHDLLMGDVWICSGQSNMELPVERVMERYSEEVRSYSNEQIRMFQTPIKYDFKGPREDLEEGQWYVLNQENALKFYATAYFYAKELYARYQVPIGLIQVAIGGTPVEAWMSEESLSDFPAYIASIEKYKDEKNIEGALDDDAKRIQQWEEAVWQSDRGLHEKVQWSQPDCNTKDWFTCQVPGFLNEKVMETSAGVIWFRKDFEVDETFSQQEARILLGTIIDRDTVYLNGEQVGETFYRYPPRIYPIPEGLLKPGKNTLVVRVVCNDYVVGFTPDKLYGIQSGDAFIDLQGEWLYKVGVETTTLNPQLFIQYQPIGVYNAMICPLRQINPKGVIWYQGESNVHQPKPYKQLFKGLIKNWRELFQNDKLPFLYVQLTNLNGESPFEAESGIAAIRQAQLETLALDAVGMAVAVDIGEWNDLHPLNKKEVGHRLALNARHVAYGEEVTYSGPIIQKAHRENGNIILTFNHAEEGLVIEGEKPDGFFVSEDGVHFIPTTAQVEGSQIIVTQDKLQQPIEVRYAWADNPKFANIYNKAHLPASPFSITVS